jgi:hypothetical protein
VRICFAKQLNNAITPLKRAGFLCESWKASTTKDSRDHAIKAAALLLSYLRRMTHRRTRDKSELEGGRE